MMRLYFKLSYSPPAAGEFSYQRYLGSCLSDLRTQQWLETNKEEAMRATSEGCLDAHLDITVYSFQNHSFFLQVSNTKL